MDLKFNRLLIMDFSHALHRSIAQPNLWEMRDTLRQTYWWYIWFNEYTT